MLAVDQNLRRLMPNKTQRPLRGGAARMMLTREITNTIEYDYMLLCEAVKYPHEFAESIIKIKYKSNSGTYLDIYLY